MDSQLRDPSALRRRGIFQKLLGGLNLRFPGLFALLLVVTLLDFIVPDPIPFIDEIVLAILTMIFALWKERRTTVVTTTATNVSSGPPLPPPARPPLPPLPPADR